MRIAIPVINNGEFQIPPSYARLGELATNLWWSWDRSADQIWRQLSPALWNRYRNPVELLAAMPPHAWELVGTSEILHELYTDTMRRFDAYMGDDATWFDVNHGTALDGPVAYLCAEYGVHPSMPGYSGGLGVLAGDHAKSASDLGVPFVGTGLAYRRGYFRQFLDLDGTQQHHYPILDMGRLPIRPVEAPTGGQLTVQIELPGRSIDVAVWSLAVGRVQLLLLDTDVASNEPADRPITHALYVRGREMRFCQELVLGIGSVRTLRALGIDPAVWHVNEGHAAMSILERLGDEVDGGASLNAATRSVKSETVFTLHTPVPAGNETFDRVLVDKYLSWWPSKVDSDMSRLHSLGWSGRDGDEAFDLGALAIRHAAVVNGVSQKHAEVASRDWAHLLGEDGALGITNGVHPATWVGRHIGRVLGTTIGADWERSLVTEPSTTMRIHEIADEEIWERHLDRKEMLARFTRSRLRNQMARHGASPDELRSVEGMLSPDRLTIGFARRFATYKRATLLFHNVPWLQSILTDPDRPVQVVFAGKAHPADRHGQSLIQQIVELSKAPELAGHIYVLEDYDIRMGGFLTQGVDVWLNNPRVPQEASGTSGMKAAMNGGLNLSVADGWWIEGYNEKNGWVFGGDMENSDHAGQDNEDAVSLYKRLQEEVVPLYYDRDAGGIPHGWVRMMKEAIASSIHDFSTIRMVQDYVNNAYVPVGR